MAQIDLQNYEPVEERISRFKDDHPNYRCLTELEHEGQPGQTRWIVKASIWRDAENEGMPDATGYAFELDGQGMTQRTAALETCETSAIGRALANLGYAGNRRVTQEEMKKPLVASLIDEAKKTTTLKALEAVYRRAQAQGVDRNVSAVVSDHKAKLEAAS